MLFVCEDGGKLGRGEGTLSPEAENLIGMLAQNFIGAKECLNSVEASLPWRMSHPNMHRNTPFWNPIRCLQNLQLNPKP